MADARLSWLRAVGRSGICTTGRACRVPGTNAGSPSRPSGRAVRSVAEMLDETGVLERTFAIEVGVEAKEVQTVTLSWRWANPRLWDVDQPNLYMLRLKARGAGLDDEFNQAFGFREIRVGGRKGFLNGTEIRLRQWCFYYGPRPQVNENF